MKKKRINLSFLLFWRSFLLFWNCLFDSSLGVFFWSPSSSFCFLLFAKIIILSHIYVVGWIHSIINEVRRMMNWVLTAYQLFLIIRSFTSSINHTHILMCLWHTEFILTIWQVFANFVLEILTFKVIFKIWYLFIVIGKMLKIDFTFEQALRTLCLNYKIMIIEQGINFFGSFWLRSVYRIERNILNKFVGRI